MDKAKEQTAKREWKGRGLEKTITYHNYADRITINGKRTVLIDCPKCGFAPHLPLENGKRICGFCGTEH